MEGPIPDSSWAGNVLLLARGERGVTAVDCSDPANPKIVWNLSLQGNSVSVRFGDNAIFIADFTGSVIVASRELQDRPTILSRVPMSGRPWRLTTLASILAIADLDV